MAHITGTDFPAPGSPSPSPSLAVAGPRRGRTRGRSWIRNLRRPDRAAPRATGTGAPGLVAARLGLDQDIASGRPVAQHRPPGAPALDQAGVPQDLQMAPHRSQPLAASAWSMASIAVAATIAPTACSHDIPAPSIRGPARRPTLNKNAAGTTVTSRPRSAELALSPPAGRDHARSYPALESGRLVRAGKTRPGRTAPCHRPPAPPRPGCHGVNSPVAHLRVPRPTDHREASREHPNVLPSLIPSCNSTD